MRECICIWDRKRSCGNGTLSAFSIWITVSRHTRKTLNEAEKAGRVINVTDDLPKTFVITTPPGKKAGEDMVYLCQLSTGTLKKRSGR